MSEQTQNRYANDWDTYSQLWDGHFGGRYRHLGDEWCDDGTTARRWERRFFANTVEPWLSPEARVLEIGPGGGKWTVQIAPQVQTLTVFDVSSQMLERTRTRCAEEQLTNVSFLLGNGRDMSAIPDQSVDLVFSYDVFVHIALEDTVAYVQEFARILREGGLAIVHHAVSDVAPAWDRIETHNDWYRDRQNTMGQYYYYSRDALDRLYARAGLRVKTAWTDYCTTVLTVEKPVDTMATRLEQALRQLATADAATLETASEEVLAVGREIDMRLHQLIHAARSTQPGARRYDLVQRMRRLIRG